MKKRTFREIGILINDIPSIIIGNLVKAGTLTLAKKYPDEPYEIDWDRIEIQIKAFINAWSKSKDPRYIIRKLKRQNKLDGEIWRNVDQDMLAQLTPDAIQKIVARYPLNKIPYNGNVAEAAREIRKMYSENRSDYSSRKAASDRFYDSHVFTNVTTTKKALYASVRRTER